MERIILSSVDRKKGNTCVDMHFHSVYSDGAATISQILEKIRKLKIGVAITDHNEIKGAVEAFNNKRDRDFLIPGIEVKSKEMVDILFYFYTIDELMAFFDIDILPNKQKYFHTSRTLIPLSNLIALSSKYRCVTSVAHPFGYTLRTTTKFDFKEYEPTLKQVDVFEAVNGGNTRKQNLDAINYIKKHKKAFTGGSDGHSIYSLGKILTCSKAKNITEFLDDIISRKNIVTGNETKLGKIGTYAQYAANKITNIFSK